jgi:hypothetical protein
MADRVRVGRCNHVEAGKVGPEPARIARQQRPALDGGVGADEEVRQHLGFATAAPAVLQAGQGVGDARGVPAGPVPMVATTRSKASKVENDNDSSA